MSDPVKKIIYPQSGIIPYRYTKKKLEILLITSLRKKNWIIPKGLIEQGMTPQESALKEAFEEAGVEGRITGSVIGLYSYQKWSGTCEVQVFPCEVTRIYNEWSEQSERQRIWFSSEKVLDKINNSDLQNIIRKFISNNN